MEPSIRTFMDFALDAAWHAGRITLSHFQNGVAFERKGDNSPVTIADHQSEQALRAMITKYWADHGIIGEEFGELPSSSRYTWIIDPIDGTKSFIHGVPFYAVLIGLTDGNESLVGVSHFPGLNETVYAGRGEGCYWNGRRANVSDVAEMSHAAVMASDVDMHNEGKNTGWQRLVKSSYIQRTWGDAYGYALVATGRAEVMLDSVVKVWDCAPFPVILEEAGGTFTDWSGNRNIRAGESIATNGKLFDEVMRLTKV